MRTRSPGTARSRSCWMRPPTPTSAASLRVDGRPAAQRRRRYRPGPVRPGAGGRGRTRSPIATRLEAEAWAAADERATCRCWVCAAGSRRSTSSRAGSLLQHVDGHVGAAYGHGPAATHPLRVEPASRLAAWIGGATDPRRELLPPPGHPPVRSRRRASSRAPGRPARPATSWRAWRRRAADSSWASSATRSGRSPRPTRSRRCSPRSWPPAGADPTPRAGRPR